jgi:hypothetical protein
MKLGKFDVAAWTWRGQELVGPFSMARRFAAFPFLFAGKGIVFLSVLCGWGRQEAQDAWKQLP